uniref:Uncharacterized protein n=1 Tax=Chromera velia CCMP2878 TaxID=1169474 RepID=A0A0G4HP24_9ALVE|mmetsp:Transcript_33836/g.67030  ORF Transcript_33836/g.67030 Transcript_33836/m.67030 type:complete len:258 (+) Transcript_33836:241-1014(+)|eukprot:Cvel_1211.t1-p1 / transcript=Cvel_1211.t1 / gene=Cvel_1211 / organism=Chromera_velia_CCMP2878 / gene_product=hypothetical protein / transcript_product=hypothetical protein / location=Cvel_scaffold40:94464-99774(+) / protein_length=257 / sequence_SO=supercontig / SO=protein_coding / is_pseudo=false
MAHIVDDLRQKLSFADVKVAALGAAVGSFSAFVVTNALLEVSFNKYFSLLFGAGFLFLGTVMFIRGRGLRKEKTLQGTRAQAVMYIFAVLTILSGVFCFLLEKQWHPLLSPMAKVPMYICVGISLSFALTFAFVDVFNYIYDKDPGHSGLHVPVRTSQQICALVVGSLFVGVVFGFFFGLLDVEDDGARHEKLTRDRYVCLPIAAIVGLWTAFAVRRMSADKRSASSRCTLYSPVVESGCQHGLTDDDAFFGDSETL